MWLLFFIPIYSEFEEFVKHLSIRRVINVVRVSLLTCMNETNVRWWMVKYAG